jgi:sugar phosphate permease
MFVRNAVGSLTLAVFVYPISLELGWSRTLISGAASLGGILSIAGSPPVGWAVDKFGSRIILTIGIIILGISTLSLTWATIPFIFYVSYAIGRVIFTGPIPIAASVVVARWFIKKRGRATGMLSFCHTGGMIVFPAVASLVIHLHSWQIAWLVLGILVLTISLIPVALLIVQIPEDVGLLPDGENPDTREIADSQEQYLDEPIWSLEQAVKTPALWILALSTGFVYFIQAGTNLHLGAYLIDQGLSQGTSNLAIVYSAIGAAAASLIWGWTSEKLPIRYVFGGVGLLMGISIGLFTLADTRVEAYVYAFLFGAAVGGIIVVPPVAYADYFGRKSLGAIRGLTEPFLALGQAIGSVLSGVIFDITGTYKGAFILYAFLGLAATFLLLFAKPPKVNMLTAGTK